MVFDYIIRVAFMLFFINVYSPGLTDREHRFVKQNGVDIDFHSTVLMPMLR